MEFYGILSVLMVFEHVIIIFDCCLFCCLMLGTQTRTTGAPYPPKAKRMYNARTQMLRWRATSEVRLPQNPKDMGLVVNAREYCITGQVSIDIVMLT